MKNFHFLTLLGCSLLVGCGGGGGGGSSSNTVTEAEVQPNQSMDEVTVPDGFDFDPMESYQLSLDISQINSERAFVSVYTQYHTRDGEIRPDYASRVVAAPMKNGRVELPFSAANAKENLLIEIWFYSDTAPLQKLHSTKNATIRW